MRGWGGGRERGIVHIVYVSVKSFLACCFVTINDDDDDICMYTCGFQAWEISHRKGKNDIAF